MHPGIKVIISEITPGMDDKDEQVKATNILLNEFVVATENHKRTVICGGRHSFQKGIVNIYDKIALVCLLLI